MESLALYSYSVSFVAYLGLFFLSLIGIKKNPLGVSISITLFFSLIWACYIVFVIQNNTFYIQDTFPVESLRNVAWFTFLSILISKQQFNSPYFLIRHTWQFPVLLVFTILVVVLESFSQLRYPFQKLIGFDFRLFTHVGFAIVGLMLVEQLYRNAILEQRWVIKFLCLGLASLFILDFIFYSKSLLFNVLDISLWEARGFVNGMVIPLLAISFNRFRDEKDKVQVSNKLIFHSTVILGAGVYLILMSLAGYYIKVYGGSWGGIAQTGFIFLAVILLLVIFVSGKIRALVKVYFSKHFFQQRYDYRAEWIKLSKKIAELNSFDDLSDFIVNTMASIADSSAGGLWIKNDQGHYFLNTDKNLGIHSKQLIDKDTPVIAFMENTQWVIDFVEYFNEPDVYDVADLEHWYSDIEDIWLIVPLFQKNKLEAFVVLTKPRAERQMDWEDHDLLKTIGMQLANALVLIKTTDDLSRSRQFEAYNRVSAFLVHDLKNLTAQISLIVKNSEKHKRNPEFIDDSIETLENVVKKIDRILGQLKKGNQQTDHQSNMILSSILDEVIQQQSANKPTLQVEMDNRQLRILGERDKLIAILGHLVQNAQEATDDSGLVEITVDSRGKEIVLKITDTGCGMDEKFIQQRLFKPFDTTKGNAGMGIGVYEAREYISQHAGKITVQSKVGMGTTFTLYMSKGSTGEGSDRVETNRVI